MQPLSSFREIYQLLNNTDFSIDEQATASSQDATLNGDLDDIIDDDLIPELHQLNNQPTA